MARAESSTTSQESDHLSSIGLRLRIACRDGVGAYLVAMMLFATAAVFIRFSLLRTAPRREAVANLRLLLKKPQEPLRDDRWPVLSAALLGEVSEWALCPTGTKQADANVLKANRVVTEAIEAFKIYYENPEAKGPPGELVRELDHDGLWSKFEGRKVEYKPDDDGEKLIKLQPTPRVSDAVREKDERFSTLRVPGTLSEQLHHNERLNESIQRSVALERLRGIVGKEIKHGGPGDEATRIHSMYFISLEGALRVVPVSKAKISPHRTFTGASYFRSTIGNTLPSRCSLSSRYDTKAYLDVVGHGVVLTSCAPVSRRSEVAGGYASEVAGVFCIDLGLPRKVVHEALEKFMLFDIKLASVTYTNSSEPEIDICGESNYQTCPKSLMAGESELPEIKEHAGIWLQQARSFGASGHAESKLVGESSFATLVWRGADEVGHPRSELAILRADVTPWDRWSVGLLAASVVASLGGLALVALSARQRLKRNEDSLLRAVRIAMVRVDENDSVIAANDRAQELLRADWRLPRFGMKKPDLDELPKFGALIDGETVLVVKGAGYAPMSYKELNESERRHGVGSTYYARLRSVRGHRWFKVSGATLVDGGGGTHTYDTIEVVGDPFVGPLQAAWDTLPGRE